MSNNNETTKIVKAPSPRLTNMIAEANFTIESAREKILAAYNYAVEVDKYSPQEAHDLLKERLVFSKRYIREVLPDEAKDLSKTKKSLMTPTTDQEPVPHPVSELEKFRQEKGKKVAVTAEEEEEEDDLSARIPDDKDATGGEHYVVYDDKTHQNYDNVIKHLTEMNTYLSRSFEFPLLIEFKDQMIPIIVIVNPYDKQVSWQLDEKEAKNLRKM